MAQNAQKHDSGSRDLATDVFDIYLAIFSKHFGLFILKLSSHPDKKVSKRSKATLTSAMPVLSSFIVASTWNLSFCSFRHVSVESFFLSLKSHKKLDQAKSVRRRGRLDLSESVD